jgi:hypothetical protein
MALLLRMQNSAATVGKVWEFLKKIKNSNTI